MSANHWREFPPLPVSPKSGTEFFQGLEGHTLHDFWCWAYSDINSNTIRGKLAEYLVSLALRCQSPASQTWNSVDLVMPEGITIEVKCSAYIQVWEQHQLSKPVFTIGKTRFWDGYQYHGDKLRHADVYVFCLLSHIHQQTLSPMNIEQWEFYPVLRKDLDLTFENNKTVTLGSLRKKLNVQAVAYANLRESVLNLMARDTA